MELSLNYASPWLRILAFFLDSLLLSVASYFLFGAPDGSFSLGGMSLSISNQGFFIEMFGFHQLFVLIPLAYFYLTWCFFSRTLGAFACRIHIVQEDGAPLSFFTASKRFLFTIIAMLPLTLGVLAMLGHPKKQGWQDRWARTFVVKG